VTGVENLVVSVYTNLFDRTPPVTDSGVQYWANQILTGAVPLGQAILDIANGALGADATTFLNKVTVSDYFISKSSVALPSSEEHSILMGVTSDPSTVTAAEATINTLVSVTGVSAAASATHGIEFAA
jgi:hypothetical protein